MMKNNLIGTLKNIQHYYEIENTCLLYVDKQYNLRCVLKDNFKEIWCLDKVYNFFINKEYVACGIVGNEKTAILHLNDGIKINEFDFDLNIRGKRTELYYYGSTYRNDEPVILKFDLSKNELTGVFPSLLGIGALLNDKQYLTDIKGKILFKKNIENDSNLWQIDISQFGKYKERKLLIGEQPEEREREIYRIFYHNEKIIVTLSRAIIAINPEDGSLLWKIDFPEYDPVELVFNENIAYLGRYVDYVVIDIEKGKKVYERDTTKDISIEISGTKINRFKYSGLVYHSNFIWFTQSFEGIQYLLKAKPENGEVIDGMVLDTKVNTYPPVFDETRVYILDMEGVLYVYEI